MAIAEEQLVGRSLKPLEQAQLRLGGASVLVACIALYTRQALTHELSVDPTLLMPRYRLVRNVKRHIKSPGHPANVRPNLVEAVEAILIVLVIPYRHDTFVRYA